MKPLRFAIPIAILALPLIASDDKDQAKSKNTGTTLSTPATLQQQDSPLVRAAKATGRLNKKPSMVITNETLAKAGGHFTSTTVNNPLPPPLPPANNAQPAVTAPQRAKREVEEKAKKDAATKKDRAAADLYGESIEPKTEDPAVQEHAMDQMTPKQQPAKPPQN